MKYFLIFMLAACSVQVIAEPRIFGLVAKSTSDPNFVRAWNAYDRAARKEGNFCELLGSPEPANAHLQARAIEAAFTSERYASIAVSVTQSSFIADRLTQTSIPVMTFDSPFKREKKLASLPYVGADNEAFGRDLLVSVGHWPVVHERAFKATMSALEEENLKTRIIAGVGRISTGHREMLRQGLLHGLVSIDFEKMGHLVYEQLKRLAQNEDVPAVTYTTSNLVPAQSPSDDQVLKVK